MTQTGHRRKYAGIKQDSCHGVQLEKEQAVRNALSELSPRCERMVRMLFFETPPRPYEEVAKELGIATGSIGFIRGRCLGKLKQQLENMGF